MLYLIFILNILTAYPMFSLVPLTKKPSIMALLLIILYNVPLALQLLHEKLIFIIFVIVFSQILMIISGRLKIIGPFSSISYLIFFVYYLFTY